MKMREAVLSISAGGEAGLMILKTPEGDFKVANLPSSPVANGWWLNRNYPCFASAAMRAELLARKAGRRLSRFESAGPHYQAKFI